MAHTTFLLEWRGGMAPASFFPEGREGMAPVSSLLERRGEDVCGQNDGVGLGTKWVRKVVVGGAVIGGS